ncbi:hypothetical protein TUMEXPCC7403_07740 [Tumidithrix helvetica PCC 7403]
MIVHQTGLAFLFTKAGRYLCSHLAIGSPVLSIVYIQYTQVKKPAIASPKVLAIQDF